MPLVDDIPGLRRILARSKTIAVVGLSANWYRPSYFAAKYLKDHGYRIIPVNPNYEEVLGERGSRAHARLCGGVWQPLFDSSEMHPCGLDVAGSDGECPGG